MAERTVDERNVPARTEGDKVPATRESSRYLIPAVDIYETKDGLTLVADLPGVKKEGLSIKVENDVLTIDGKVQGPRHGSYRYGEYELLDYHRQFALGQAVDQAKIAAELKNGVLTLSLPKAEAAKPKQIEVKVG